MLIYSRLWAGAAAVLTLTGMLLCLVLVPPGLWLVLGALAGAAAAGVHSAAAGQAARRRLGAPSKVEAVVIASSATAALVGFGALMPVLALVVLLALGAAGLPLVLHLASAGDARPPAGRARVRVAERRGTPAPSVRPTTTVRAPLEDIGARLGPVVAAWPDDQLCRAWRASYTRLASSDERVLAAVAWERQLYLDEIERRHPHGFHLWLNAHPRAASNPGRFLPSAPTTRSGPDRPPC